LIAVHELLASAALIVLLDVVLLPVEMHVFALWVSLSRMVPAE
jgi:hypothetical protein